VADTIEPGSIPLSFLVGAEPGSKPMDKDAYTCYNQKLINLLKIQPIQSISILFDLKDS
jgi:hypothetical protein